MGDAEFIVDLSFKGMEQALTVEGTEKVGTNNAWGSAITENIKGKGDTTRGKRNGG